MLIIRQDGGVALLLDLLSLPKTYMGNLKAGDWQEQPLQQRAVATDKDPYTHFTHVYVHCCHLVLLNRGGELLELWGFWWSSTARTNDVVPEHMYSSDQSPQSFSRSHFHHVGIQRPFLHSYWKYLEQPGTSVGAAATSRETVSLGFCWVIINVLGLCGETKSLQEYKLGMQRYQFFSNQYDTDTWIWLLTEYKNRYF